METQISPNVSYASSFAVSTVVGPNGATTNTAYDNFGRPLSTTVADGAVTNFTYSGYTQKATFNDSLGPRWAVTTVDGFGRTTRVQTGHDTTTISTVDTQYAPSACSPLGKVSAVSQPYAPGATPVWATYTYDGRGRVLTITGPDGSSTTHYAYQGNQTTVTDPAGNWKTYTNDAFGNLLSVTEPGSLVTNYTYNVVNQLTQVSMPRNSGTQTRTFTWSGPNLMTAANPENGTVTYTYNAVNQVTSRTDALQNQAQYTYDSYGRQTKVQHFLWTGGQLQVQPQQEWDYYYDTNPFNSSFSTNTWGRIAAVSFSGPNAPGTLSYQFNYNAAGRVLTQRFALPAMAPYPSGLNLDATYTWDNQGRVAQMAYPQSGPVYAYGFDVMGRPTTMQENGTQMATVSYNWANQITAITYDAFSDTRTYDPLTLQMTRLTTQQTTPTLSTILDMSYTYNVGLNNGQIAQSIDHVLGETVNYTYDPLKRLSTAQATGGAWGQTFTYDGFGNLTTATGTGAAPSLSLTIDPATNRGFGTSSTTQYYDANGNAQGPNAASGNPYTYDIENRLMTGGYTYDPSGKRVLQETLTNGSISQLQVYFYAITGQRIATYKSVSNGSGGFTQTTSLNLFFGGKQIRVAGVTVATDRLGSVRVNASGVQFRYWPYGQERTSTSNGQEKFGTYFRDDGYLDYADQRYYYATGGRFWTPDPASLSSAQMANPTSWNMYAYVTGDPVNFNDPTGQCGVSTGDDATDDAILIHGPAHGRIGPLDDCGGGFIAGPAIFGIPIVTSEFSPITDTSSANNEDVAMGDMAPALGMVYQTTAPLTQASTWVQGAGLSVMTASVGLLVGPSVTAGMAVMGLGALGTAESPSILSGDLQSSFNFGASVQPTITTAIDGLGRVYGDAPGQSQLSSPWLGAEASSSPAQSISIWSLPPTNPATNAAAATVGQGATVVFGTAAPLYGQSGGGFQVFATPVSCITFTPCQ